MTRGDGERITTATLVDLLGGWATTTPLYRALAGAIAALVRSGVLPDGTRLPPERALADALPAARGTVVAAYRSLADDGLVVRRQGSGTTVRAERRGDVPTELAAGLRAQSLTARALHPGALPVDLALAVLDDPEALPPTAFALDAATLSRATAGVSGRGHGYAPLGVGALRDRIAEMLSQRGCPTSAEEVAITAGAQHGIALAAAVLTEPGDVVAIEEPTYPGAIDAYSRAGCSFRPLRTDGGGTVPEDLAQALAGDAIRVVHLAPQCASPTGIATTLARRRSIADLLDGAGAASPWLVEDAALEFLVPPLDAPYLSASRPERSLLVGTVSKVFWGGLRVGWVRAPVAVVERIGRLRAGADLGSPIGPQITALRLFDDLDQIAQQRRAQAARRRAHLLAGLARHLPELAVARADGGLCLWVQVPGRDADHVVAAAARHGLDIVSGRVCSVRDGGLDRVRISAWAPLPVLDEAVRRLATALA